MADEDDEIARAEPVQWLSISELWNSAKRAALAKTIGDYVDRREVFAALDAPTVAQEDVRETRETWVDYVADVGDGYRATRAVALCQNSELSGGEGVSTERAPVIIFGGDQVYPTPSVEAYQTRFLLPYDGMLANRAVYAIPGNHDWYDGLTAYFKVFAQGSRLLRQATQTRSYFAFRVDQQPWWVWGLDFGLSGALDVPQTTYFSTLSTSLAQLDGPYGLVICTAEPFWEKGKTLVWDAIAELIPSNVTSVLFLSGDKHYLATWATKTEDDVVQPATEGAPELTGRRVAFVTAGGGGAYLSLTSAVPDEERVCKTRRGAPYPDGKLKRSLLGRALSPRSGIWPLSMAAYATMITIVRLASQQPALLAGYARQSDDEPSRMGLREVIAYLADSGGWLTTAARFLREAAGATVPWVGGGLIVLAMVAFARKGAPHNLTNRWIPRGVGTVHGLAHLVGITFVGVAALELGALADDAYIAAIITIALVAVTLALFRPPTRTSLILVGSCVLVLGSITLDAHFIEGDWLSVGLTYVAVMLAGGALIGHALFIAYLAIVANFGLNLNEASVALASENHKNFVRLRFDANAELTVFCFGIDDTDAVVKREAAGGTSYDDLCKVQAVLRLPLA